MIATDLAVIAFAVWSSQQLGFSSPAEPLWLKTLVIAAVTVLALHLADLYQVDFRVRRVELASRLFVALLASATMTAAIGFALPSLSFGRLAFLYVVSVIGLWLLISRLAWSIRGLKGRSDEKPTAKPRPSWLIFADGFVQTDTPRMVKRAIDVPLAFIGLVLLLPLMGVLACAIKLTSKGSVLFREERVGPRGRNFVHCKFRTTYLDGPRVTPIGRWLRRTGLDELPQFWNVLAGDMSFFDRSWIFRR
jgi:hypothetical protein